MFATPARGNIRGRKGCEVGELLPLYNEVRDDALHTQD